MEVPRILADFATHMGEGSLRPIQGFKSTVFVGEKFIFKTYPTAHDASKEQCVLNLLNKKLPHISRTLVPRFITAKTFEDIGTVHVHTRLNGQKPADISSSLAIQLGHFLRDLHDSGTWKSITSFDDKETTSFISYIKTAPAAFAEKINESSTDKDRVLIQTTLEHIRSLTQDLHDSIPLVLVHKDIYFDNLLIDAGGNLTGVIDWGAAQTAPREWEFAILRQRMPDQWNHIMTAYDLEVDIRLLDLCGLVQSLRFWKSFPNDVNFVDTQRVSIQNILKGTT